MRQKSVVDQLLFFAESLVVRLVDGSPCTKAEDVMRKEPAELRGAGRYGTGRATRKQCARIRKRQIELRSEGSRHLGVGLGELRLDDSDEVVLDLTPFAASHRVRCVCREANRIMTKESHIVCEYIWSPIPPQKTTRGAAIARGGGVD